MYKRSLRQGHSTERIVIVGASLAGLRAAEALRNEGFTGHLTIVGAEPYTPYDRPPLSKQVLAGRLPVEHTELALLTDLQTHGPTIWRLGVAATALDIEGRQLCLSTGERLSFDQLLIATGTRARPWPEEKGGRLDGVFLIRKRDDTEQLRARLSRKPAHVLIVGGGFIGCEVASVCRELDLAVTLTERGPTPLYGALGSRIGGVVARLQREHGVDLRTQTTVVSFEGDDAGHVRRACLSDGSVLEIDVAIVSLGALPNTEWLQGSGITADARGVTCDSFCRVLDTQGQPVPGIFVAGDVARWPQHLLDGEQMAVEHWGNAVDQARNAAHNMLKEPRAYRHIPAFWSSQFGVNIKAVGLPNLADEVIVTQGSEERYRFMAAYGRRGRMIAAVSFDQGRWLEVYSTFIERGMAYPPHLAAADQPAEMQSHAAGLPVVAQHA